MSHETQRHPCDGARSAEQVEHRACSGHQVALRGDTQDRDRLRPIGTAAGHRYSTAWHAMSRSWRAPRSARGVHSSAAMSGALQLAMCGSAAWFEAARPAAEAQVLTAAAAWEKGGGGGGFPGRVAGQRGPVRRWSAGRAPRAAVAEPAAGGRAGNGAGARGSMDSRASAPLQTGGCPRLSVRASLGLRRCGALATRPPATSQARRSRSIFEPCGAISGCSSCCADVESRS